MPDILTLCYIDISEYYKLGVIGKPILGVVGTGGSQGKFNIQVGLRYYLESHGYRVAQLGTEPTSQIFGIECVYPMGYESSVYTKGFESVYSINRMLMYLERMNPDIIIWGSQGNTVSYQVGGPRDYPIVQQELILAGQADAYFLVVSEDAGVEYVKRTVAYLESVHKSKVLALIFSTFTNSYRWSSIGGKHISLPQAEITEAMSEYEKALNIPIYAMNDEHLMSKLTSEIEEYFV